MQWHRANESLVWDLCLAASVLGHRAVKADLGIRTILQVGLAESNPRMQCLSFETYWVVLVSLCLGGQWARVAQLNVCLPMHTLGLCPAAMPLWQVNQSYPHPD